jgi:hypothetical protein
MKNRIIGSKTNIFMKEISNPLKHDPIDARPPRFARVRRSDGRPSGWPDRNNRQPAQNESGVMTP